MCEAGWNGLDELVDHVARELLEASQDGIGSCCYCGGPCDEQAVPCETCVEVRKALGFVLPITAITLYVKPSLIRNVLTHYKLERDGFAPEFDSVLRILLKAYLSEASAGAQLVRDSEVILTVPSTRTAANSRRFDSIAAQCFHGTGLLHITSCLEYTGEEVSHRHANRWAFRVSRPDGVRGKRVLLVDDVYTTGSRSQSAAGALLDAGADSVKILVIGRRVNMDYSEAAAALITQKREQGPPSWARSIMRPLGRE